MRLPCRRPPFARIEAIVLLLALLIACAGCDQQRASIRPRRLSTLEWRLVELVNTSGQTPILFTFDAGTMRAVRAWIEYYRDGELVERSDDSLIVERGEQPSLRGTIVVKQEWIMGWSLKIQSASGPSNRAMLDSPPASDIVGTGSFAQIETAMPIQGDRDIVLYAFRLIQGNEQPTMPDDLQTLASPETLTAGCDVAFVVKCRFDE